MAAVTGGASGIGLARATLLAGRGARVAVFDLIPDSLPDGITGIVGDVTSRESVAGAFRTITLLRDHSPGFLVPETLDLINSLAAVRVRSRPQRVLADKVYSHPSTRNA